MNWTPFLWEVSSRRGETVKYLLSVEGIDNEHRDLSRRTPLVVAAESGDIENVRYLIDTKSKGRQISHVERDLMIWSIFQEYFIAAQLVLETDEILANHRVKGRTPLSLATELGDIEMTGLPVDAEADSLALDEIRWPPLCGWLFETYLPYDDILLEIENFSAVDCCRISVC